ncbi:hypothetical protein GQ600_5520 [Phytophthora cactorum]|nr:hypothetical protein GQ600_5520 [Phytophthora cactorum]
MTMIAARGDERADDAADFLRRLSVADAKVLLDRTRKEKENKTKEMQKMIGVRYRDLIESADKIVNMHSAALRLEVSLKEMPDMWKHMELSLAGALAVEGQISNRTEDETLETQEERRSETTDADEVAFLVEVAERIWQLLDEGESLQALELYQRATKIHSECVAKTTEHEFPFLQTQWTCIQCFRPRMVSSAKSYLTCRGKESRFYADNLCTLAVLNEPPIGPDKLFEVFLESRSKWMTPLHKRDEQATHQSSSKKERVLMIILKSISMTMTQTEEIFGNGSESGLLKSISQLPPSFKDGLEQFISSGKMLKILSDWFERKRRQILEIASPIISSIDSISQLSQVQSKLYVVNKNSGGCQNVQLWGHVLQEARGSLEKQLNGPVDSVFSVLFAEAFRKRTRDLVQHSFVEALEAIKTQIRASVEDTVASISRSDYRLRNVKFYDYFETIQKKAADLDASDLQSVLIEEFLRTLFKLVIFFEKEYPVIQKPNAPNGAIQLPSVFLSISNILAGIVAGFHRQTNNGFVMKAKLTATLELFVNVLHGLSKKYCEAWATILLEQKIDPLRELMLIEQYDSPTRNGSLPTKLGRCEPIGSKSIGTKDEQIKLMQRTIREVLVEQLTISTKKDSVLNFGECCIQQFLFDMYFVRATLGFSDFIRFGWGDELNPEDCSPGLLKLKSLFERMREFIDPVDWEIYGPQLIENVVLQFRKSRLLFSSLSESNDINKISKSSLVLM